MNDTMLSRSGNSCPAGKLTRRLDIPVSEQTEEAVIAMAMLAGLPKAEYVRRIIERAMFGELTMTQRMVQPQPYGNGMNLGEISP